ncbi:unnamed protein product [Cladocopium goreaui]|uniref:Uncharacterized protein n=1 Tax=Cladocopium goreaui TaxID=2562237 RepID=A0A9P1CMS1_9DINO|nr:unnamed protein product [Cladocopium goreaui]
MQRFCGRPVLPKLLFLCPWLATMAFLVPRPVAPAPALRGMARMARSGGEVAEMVSASDVSSKASFRNATEEDRRNAETAYEIWKDQFPLAAARREYYGLDCTTLAVQDRFLHLSQLLGISSKDTLETFRKDFWVLSERSESLPAKLEALRSCGTNQEVLDFLRWAPRSIATTSAEEIQERGLANMLLRSFVGEVWELFASPLRILVKLQLARSAEEVEQERANESGMSNEELLKKEQARNRGRLRSTAYAFFATLIGTMSWASYMDATYGGPVHGKGFCFPAGIMPAYNLPDAEGNARLPCNCAPLYKWYLEPLMSSEQKDSMLGAAPKVDSKNCGRLMGGVKKDCDPRTVGGCVWSAEDLEKDPSAWEHREELYWERQR